MVYEPSKANAAFGVKCKTEGKEKNNKSLKLFSLKIKLNKTRASRKTPHLAPKAPVSAG